MSQSQSLFDIRREKLLKEKKEAISGKNTVIKFYQDAIESIQKLSKNAPYHDYNYLYVLEDTIDKFEMAIEKEKEFCEQYLGSGEGIAGQLETLDKTEQVLNNLEKGNDLYE